MKNDAAGRAFLDLPLAQTGAPAHLLTVYTKKAQGVPPTRAAFAAELARKGFAQAPAAYQAFKKRDPDFTLSDGELTAWGYKLLRDGEIQSSIAILALNGELHADSWNAFDSLGEAYANGGNRAAAIAAYRKSLILNPSNGNAVDQLAKLGVKS